METQLQHGHHNHEEDPHNTGLHSGEKKSVLKKVKDKAKKIKDTIKKHEGGHRRDDIHQQGFQDDADDDDDDEVDSDPEVHGAPKYESSAITSSNMPRESITNLEKPRDRYNQNVRDVGTTQPHNTTRMGLDLEEDPHAPRNSPADVLPSNYQSKVTDPAGAGGKEADVAPLVDQLGNLNVGDHDAAGSRHVQFENTSKGRDSGSMAGKVGETLGPVYEKVAGTGSAVFSKVYGMVGGASTKEYLSEKFRPGDEDKALSEVITNALQKKKKEKEEKQLGKVTMSKEVEARLGGVADSKREGEDAVAAGEESSGQGMVERFTDAVGLWLGKSNGIETAKDSVSQSHVSDAS